MPPLTYQHRVPIVEIGHHESRVRIGQDRINCLGTVRKTDHVLAQLEWVGSTFYGRASHLEWPAAGGMEQLGYWRTTDATAAAAAAT